MRSINPDSGFSRLIEQAKDGDATIVGDMHELRAFETDITRDREGDWVEFFYRKLILRESTITMADVVRENSEQVRAAAMDWYHKNENRIFGKIIKSRLSAEHRSGFSEEAEAQQVLTEYEAAQAAADKQLSEKIIQACQKFSQPTVMIYSDSADPDQQTVFDTFQNHQTEIKKLVDSFSGDRMNTERKYLSYIFAPEKRVEMVAILSKWAKTFITQADKLLVLKNLTFSGYQYAEASIKNLFNLYFGKDSSEYRQVEEFLSSVNDGRKQRSTSSPRAGSSVPDDNTPEQAGVLPQSNARWPRRFLNWLLGRH